MVDARPGRRHLGSGIGNLPAAHRSRHVQVNLRGLALGGDIDPVITIDPIYAARFSVVQRSISIVAVPVPEASTLAMVLGGIGGWSAQQPVGA